MGARAFWFYSGVANKNLDFSKILVNNMARVAPLEATLAKNKM